MQSDQVLIFGDFHTPAIYANHNAFCSNIICNFTFFNNLEQCNDVLNNHKRVLDLVMSNLTCEVRRSDLPLVSENAYNPALKIRMEWKHNVQTNFSARPKTICYNFRKANYPLMYELRLSKDWFFLNHVDDVNVACMEFYKVIHSVFMRLFQELVLEVIIVTHHGFLLKLLYICRQKRQCIQNTKIVTWTTTMKNLDIIAINYILRLVLLDYYTSIPSFR